jgi:hypothetical protein
MRRDTWLVIALTAQAAVSAAVGSAALASIAAPQIIAGISLLNAMLSSAVGAYVAATRASHVSELEVSKAAKPRTRRRETARERMTRPRPPE